MTMLYDSRKTRQRRNIYHILVCIIIATMSLSAWAQMDQGTITGVVQDATGAVIPNAQVTLTCTDTGLQLQTKSNRSGEYSFPPAKVGNYKINVAATGFQTTTQENIQLDVQARLNIALVLVPGAVSETVTVSTAPPLLQTQEGSVEQVI